MVTAITCFWLWRIMALTEGATRGMVKRAKLLCIEVGMFSSLHMPG